ncbi:hypothetical protein ABDJ25_32590 [Streptomyces actinocidus]
MPSAAVTRPFAVCAALALLAGCGGSGDSGGDGSGKSGRDASASRAPDVVPTESRPPAPGRGSGDPDDINGDGHRDLLMEVSGPDPGSRGGGASHVAVVFGTKRGPDPTVRSVYSSRELGLPAVEPPGPGRCSRRRPPTWTTTASRTSSASVARRSPKRSAAPPVRRSAGSST